MIQIDLAGRTALVTGGTIGIGQGIALALARAGADVAVTYLTHFDAGTVVELERLGRRAVAYKLDATISADVDAVVAAAAAALGGGLDILVCNAGGLIERSPIATMSDALWASILAANVTSAFYTVRAALRHLRDGGRIVLMGSVAGHNGGGPGAVAYAASKAAIHTLTRGLAKELAPRSITVNALAPGFIAETPFHATFTAPEAQRAIIASLPLQRAGLPADVAGAALYLASDLGAWVTGEVMEINGGAWFA